MKKFGLALGGGGAKGLAHVPLLEVFDELGMRPHRIAGTSIGAVVGALYASGLSGARIREGARKMVVSRRDTLREALRKRDALKWFGFLDLEFGRRGLLKGDKFIEFLYGKMGVRTFEELKIPLRVVATDFNTAEQVLLDSGSLPDAIKASMGLPGVFTPVTRGGRVLIDGGGVNPVPWDVLGDCDYVVAVDVMGDLDPASPPVPNLFRAVLGTFDIMQKSIIAEKLRRAPPDLYIRPAIRGVDILDFHRAEDVFEMAAPAARELKQALQRVL